MAANLPMMISLQLDSASAARVAKNIESALSRVQIKTLDTKALAKTNAAIKDTAKQLDSTGRKAEKFWDTLEGKARSGIAYTIVSTALLKITGAVSQAVRESMKYEAELLKISQVTGDSVAITKSYQKALFSVSKEYNVSITKVGQLTRTLTQTGLSFREAAKGAEILSRTSLLATFDSLTSTTEGLIAVMQTFNLNVNQSGKVLEQINDVSKAFAVESSDIVEAIRRTGGAFSSAGGQVEELIALFTSVRSTSRESAETIATGFRTIFGRLQRPKTIEYFKQLGIQLQTAEGQFIGPLKAIEEIGKGLDRLGIQAGSVKFAQVVEQIGGIRQISRVVPLLEQYRKTQQAIDIQSQSSVGTYDDIKKAQQGLGFQVGQLKQEFLELISSFVNSDSFKIIAKTFIGFTRTIISLTKALKPVLPLLTALFTFKIGRGMSKLLSGGFSLDGAKKTLGFAAGGMVPGSGNGDTVPAMLTPGEFVIRKSAVQAFGADRLANINKYNKGGIAEKQYGKISLLTGDRIQASYMAGKEGENNKAKGHVLADKLGDIYSVQSSSATKGYGPRLYDVVMEAATEAGSMLTSDRRSVSDSAKKVWDFYFNRRSDVKKTPLDPINWTSNGRLIDEKLYGKPDTWPPKTDPAWVLQTGYSKNPSIINNPDFVKKLKTGGAIQKFKEGGVAGVFDGMYDALKNYTEDSSGINLGLSGKIKIDPEKKKTIASLDSLFDYGYYPPKDLYAGFGANRTKILTGGLDHTNPELRDSILENKGPVSFPGYFSTSEDESVAWRFKGSRGSLVHVDAKPPVIDVVKAAKDLDIRLPATLSQELEYILPKDSQFSIEAMRFQPDGSLSADLKQFKIGGLVQKFKEGGDVGSVPSQNSSDLNAGAGIKLSKEVLNDLLEYTIKSYGLNSQLSGIYSADEPSRYADVNYSREIKNLDSLMMFDLPSILYSGYHAKKYQIIKNKVDSLSPDPKNPDFNLLKGEVLTFPGFLSSSTNYEVAKNFSSNVRGGVMTIKTKGKGIDVVKALMSSELITDSDWLRERRGGEKEFILPRNSKFKVENVKENFEVNEELKDLNFPGGGRPLLSYFLDVQQLATGGKPKGTGTDTVPALLTPGEFVINKKSAQSFGYDKLHEINKYKVGGVVDEDPNKAKTGKASRTLTKTERKQRLEQYKSDQLGTSLTRGERSGGWQKEILAKYSKLIADEKAAIQEVYAEKIKTAIIERKSIGNIINKKNAAQKEAERAGSLGMNRAIADKSAQIAAKRNADKLKEASKELVIVETDMRSALEKLVSSIVENVSKFNISFAEVVWDTEAIANSLEAYGVAINRDALEAGKTKGAQFSIAADMVRKVDEKSINKLADSAKGAGSALRKFGKTVGGKWGSAIEKAGGGILAFGAKVGESAATLAKLAKFAGRVLDVMAYLELAGGFFDSLFSKDYKQIKELAIERGDVGAAGEAAAAQYNQEFLRGIPIIGGFLSAMQDLIPEYFLQLGATGRLVVATAELQASINGLDKKIKKAQEAYLDAARGGDNLGMQEALNQQDAAIADILSRANSQTGKIEQARAESVTDIATRTAMGVAGGALAGAAIGGTIGGILGSIGGPFAAVTAAGGAIIGAGVGALVGGITAFISAWDGSQEAILEAYQVQGEAIEKWGEAYSEQTRQVGDAMTQSALQVLKAGGSLDDAFVKLKEVFGEDRVNEMFKGGTDGPGIRKSYDDANKEYQAAQQRAEDARKALDERRIEEAAAWSDWLMGSRSQAQQNRAAAEVELDRAEAAEKVSAAEKEAILNFQIKINQQIALNKQIEIENRAMRERIALSKEMTAVFDKINYSLYDMKIASENVGNAASGRISGGQILSERNIGIDERTLRMSGDEVLRNEDAFNQMFEAVSRLGSVRLSGSLREAKQNYDAFGQIEDLLLNNNALGSKISEIVAEAKQQASESLTSEGGGVEAGTLIADSIKDALAASGIQLNAQLDEAIQEYGNLLAAGTESSAAIEKIREKLGKEAADLIEKTSAKYNEYIQMEQEYHSYKIELIRKNAELTQKAYNAEREYFEQRIALTNKIEDILNPEPVGPRRASFLESRASQRRDRNFEGLKAARSRGNMPDDTARSEIGFQAGVRSLQGMNLASSEAAEKLAKLAESGNMLLNTLQDEIKYEQDYLDALIESAKAQQEYTQALNDAQGELVRSLVTGTDEEQADLLSTLNAAAYSAMQGSFQGIPADMKKDIFSIFDQFGDVEIPGLGMTGRDAQREITRNELMMNWGLDAATADQLASKAVKDRVPIDERMKHMIEVQEQKILELLERERQMKQYLQMIDMYQNQIFAQAVDKFRQAIDDFVNNQLNAQQGNPVGNMAANAAFELEALKDRQAKEMATQDEEIKKAKEAKQAAEAKVKLAEEKEQEAKTDLESKRSNLARTEESAQVSGMTGRMARGRLPRRREDVRLAEERANAAGNDRISAQQEATAAEERTIRLEEDRDALQSRQADERELLIETRQAEINATSVSINGNPITPTTQARGGVIYAANGQLVNYEPRGTDTVPAMLTPGEFVMRKSAVDRIGVDNLERMNREGVLYAEDGTEVPDPQLAYRQELINRIKNERQNIEERTGDLGILGSLFAGFRNLTTGDGGNIGDAVSQSKINAYQNALNYGDEELIRQLATGRGAYGGTAANFGEVATGQAELMDTQNELAKDLYMTVPKVLAGYTVGTAASSYSAISGVGLKGAEIFGMNLAAGSMTALPMALMKEAPNAALEGRELDKDAIGRDIIGDTIVGPALDMLPFSSLLGDSAGSLANTLRQTKIGGNATTAVGEGVDILGRAGQTVFTNMIEDEAANNFNKGGRVKYLSKGGSSGGPYRSQANINRFGASDPRFEQYGLRGLDPNSEYYQQALAYWQQVMDFQNKYNQRAAYWNQGIAGQQMQWMQMMQGMWGQSGYFAKGGKVQYLKRGGRNPVNPHTLAPLQEKLDRDSMGSVVGDAAHNLTTLVPGAFDVASTPFIVGKEGSDKRERNQARSDEFDELYKHYMLEGLKNIEATTGIFSTLSGRDENGKSKWGSYERQEAESKYKIFGDAGVHGGKWLDRMLGDRKTNEQLLADANAKGLFEDKQRKDKESRDAAQAKVDKARDPFIESFRKKRKGGGGGKPLSDRLAEMNANIDRMNREREAKYGVDENGNVRNAWPELGDEDYAGSYREKNWKAMEYGTTLDDIGQTRIGAAAAAAAAAPAELPVEPTDSSFTPTGNVGVDGLMNKPLGIKKGNDRGNQARYRSRLDALRRAGADNKALDEFKAQYRGKAYGAENQQLYDYNKARLSGRAAHMINPKDRTPEQQARAEAYKNDILTPNAEARKKSSATGSPMPSIASRAAEYHKRKTGGAAAAAGASAAPASQQQASGQLGGALGSTIGGTLGGLFGGQTGAVLGSTAGNVLGNLANLPNGNNLQAMTSQMNGGANQQGQAQLQPNRNAAPNIPAQVASQSRTSNLLGANQNNGSSGTSTGYGGGMGGGGPIQVNTTGTQEIIVRLPDIQALVNQSITSLIYDTIGSTFKNLADKVMTANNFEDVANSLSQGYTDATTKQVNSKGQVGGK